MIEMNRIERVLAVVAGEQPDRPPVSFWHHFPPDAVRGQEALDAHLRFRARYDLDFLKVMNDNPYPEQVSGTDFPVGRTTGWKACPTYGVLAGDEEGFGAQLDLIRRLAAALSGEVLLVTTLFNAWATLRRLVHAATGRRHGPPNLSGAATGADVRLSELLAEDRTAVASALDAIATSLAHFAGRCLEAGADGIFLSVRDDWVNTEANGPDTYDEMVRPGDQRILSAAAAGRCNILHVCGVVQDFDAFAAYPVGVINWADRAGGPAIGEVIGRVRPAVCGGVDNLSTLPDGTPAAVESEVRDALRQAGDRPMILAPGCTFDPDRVPEENLEAMVRASRGP